MAMDLQPPPAATVEADVALALAEDIGSGDVTAALLPDSTDSAYLLCKEDAVVCGRPWFDACHRALDPQVRIHWRVAEGDRVPSGTVLATLEGRTRALVSAERASLNFLQTLSATATTTAAYVDAVRGTGTRILDTRKTIPGLRQAQKYAVRCGGGANHRMGLFDALLVKDNHIRAAGSLAAAVTAARRAAPDLPLEVEVETLHELQAALDLGCGLVLLDNMPPATMTEAARRSRGRARLEASGGVTLTTVRAVAQTGVDYIAVGALTHAASSLDLALDWLTS